MFAHLKSKEAIAEFSLRILVLLNFIDLISTMILYEWSIITEGNPFMDYLLSTDAFLYSLAKLFLLYVGVIILYVYRKRAAAFYAAIGTTLFYALIVVKHALIGLYAFNGYDLITRL